jgi:hypothetical protein
MYDAERWAAAADVSPLTVLVRGVLEWAFPPGAFEQLAADAAPDHYTRKLTVDALAWMMIQVVSGARPSVHAAYRADRAGPAPTLPASPQALYAKLGRVAPPFATAAVRHAGARLAALLPAAGRDRCPGWAGYRVRLLDGTDLGGTEHRLGVLRRVASAGLPGRLVVEYDLATGLVVDAVASEDAYASERTLAEAVVARARPRDLFVADRHFSTAAWMFGLIDRKARFVVRQSPHAVVVEQTRRRRVGRVATGVVWEQAVTITRRTGARRRVRRVIVALDEPTRAGETDVCLLTNLPARVAAGRVADLYRRRWTLERHFDFLRNCLCGELAGLGRPRAAIFAVCLAMVAGNAVAVVERALAAQPAAAERLSGYYLADEVAGNYRAIDRLIPAALWAGIAGQTAEAFWTWCVRHAAAVRTLALRASPRGPKKPPPERASGKRRKHYATFRLLEAAKKQC